MEDLFILGKGFMNVMWFTCSRTIEQNLKKKINNYSHLQVAWTIKHLLLKWRAGPCLDFAKTLIYVLGLDHIEHHWRENEGQGIFDNLSDILLPM